MCRGLPKGVDQGPLDTVTPVAPLLRLLCCVIGVLRILSKLLRWLLSLAWNFSVWILLRVVRLRIHTLKFQARLSSQRSSLERIRSTPMTQQRSLSRGATGVTVSNGPWSTPLGSPRHMASSMDVKDRCLGIQGAVEGRQYMP